MEEEEEDDLKLHRASAWAIKEIKEGLDSLVAGIGGDSKSAPEIRLRTQHIVNQVYLLNTPNLQKHLYLPTNL